MDHGHANLSFAASLLDGAVRAGLRHVVVCPGSRSTPLALAAALHPALRTWVLIDERSAAFFALGVARQLGQTVALICTSGTAAANFAPAVIEAYLSRVPLLVLTADRPAELRNWGAAQTINQVGLYGDHTRWFADLPAPVGDPAEERLARATAARAVQLADGSPPGPVHLNVQFREPLIPADTDPTALLRDRFATPASAETPPRTVRLPSVGAVSRLTDLVSSQPRGAIVCGPHSGGDLGNVVAAFATVFGYPVLADPLSTVRFSWTGDTGLIDAYDLFLRDSRLAAALAPHVVIRLGGMPTSKPLTQWLARQDATVVAIDPGELRDANHAVTWHVQADEAATLDAVTAAMGNRRPAPPDWLSCWQQANARTRAAVTRQMGCTSALSEPEVAASLLEILPDGATLVVGNSMPVRDVDTFAAGGNRRIRVVGTRGASGIDGVTSTAIGAAAVASGPVALLVGDLSFLHDLGGLHAASLANVPLVIVVVNNDGGGIFSFLPQHGQLDTGTFERLFGTPAAVDVEGAARLFACRYVRPQTFDQFRAAVTRALAEPHVTIIEVRTNRADNLALHRQIAASVLADLEEAGAG